MAAAGDTDRGRGTEAARSVHGPIYIYTEIYGLSDRVFVYTPRDQFRAPKVRVHLPVPLEGTGATFNVPMGRVHLPVSLAGTGANYNVPDGRVHLPVPLAGTGATFNVPTGRMHLLVPLAGTCATFNVLTGRVHLPLSQPVGYNFHVQKVRVRGQGQLSCPKGQGQISMPQWVKSNFQVHSVRGSFSVLTR